MATQGVVALVDESGKTLVKAVCGCNGYNADKLGKNISRMNLRTIEEIYNQAINDEFGCQACLVIMDEQNAISHDNEELSS
jgi:NAD(P)H-nitrite reductase large subunit